jgi:type I restriction enzyme S subunit
MTSHDLRADWKVGCLEDVLEICDSGTWGEPGSENDFPVLRSTNIHNGTMVLEEVAFRKGIGNPERYVLKNGDILVTKSSGSEDLIGKCCMFTDPNDGKRYLFSNFTQRLRTNQKMLSEYLYYFLVSDWGKRNLARLHETTSGLRNLNMKRYVKQELPIPPVNAQRGIVQLIRKADALTHLRKNANQLTSKIIQSVFQKMFGDLYHNKNSFGIRKLDELKKQSTQITYGIVQAGRHVQDGVPYIKTGDIRNGQIRQDNLSRTDKKIAERYKRSEVHYGDLVYSIRATVGTVALLPRSLDGANLTQGTAKISPGPLVNRHYLLWYLRSDGCQAWIKNRMKGATFKEITLATLRETPILLPPISLQEKFAEMAEKVERIKRSQEQSRQEINNLFDSLLHEAFRGELPSEIDGG